MLLLTKNSRLNKKVKRAIGIVFIMLLIISGISSCSKKEAVVPVINDILVVDGVVVSKPEIMIYVYQVVDEFEKIGGENVWEFEDFNGGKSAIEVAKEAVLENIVRMKVINKKAKELGILLSEEQEANAKAKAKEYFKSMKADYVQTHEITNTLMLSVFNEFALTNEVMANVTSDFTPSADVVQSRMNENEEYSRVKQVDRTQLLTEIDAQHIYIETIVKEPSGSYVTLTEKEKDLKYKKAEMIYQKALEGVSFEELIAEYSDEQVSDVNQGIGDAMTNPNKKTLGNYIFSKGLLTQTPFASLIDLKKGAISSIIEDETGYHIFKIKSVNIPTDNKIVAFDEEFKQFESDLRQTIEKEVVNENFELLYKQWKELVVVTLDKEQWNKISLQN